MLTREILSVQTVDTLAIIAVVVVIAGLTYRFIEWRRYSPPNLWRDIRGKLGWRHIIATFIKELVNRVILERDLFNERWRWFAHITMFWGFVGLAVTTAISYVTNYESEYVPLATPYRLLGNACGALLLLGSTIAILRLILIPRFRRERTFGDIWFTALIWLAALTGFTTEYFREVAYYTPADLSVALLTFNYVFHLAAVGLLVVTAPFSAFTHALTTPTLRYYEQLHQRLIEKVKARDYREEAQLTQIEDLYTKTKS
jgi:nitrate reductase gamma subunit